MGTLPRASAVSGIPPSVFMSHAKDDEAGKSFFNKLFASSRIKANWYHYTDGRTFPHILGIRSAIGSSSALFVVLSRQMEQRPHTRSWISYEAGIAVGMNRPVWVFEPIGQRIEIPVPGAWGYLQRPADTSTLKTFPFERIVKSAGTEFPMTGSDIWFRGMCNDSECRERFVAYVLDPGSASCPTCRKPGTIRRQSELELGEVLPPSDYLKPIDSRPWEVADSVPFTVRFGPSVSPGRA